MTEISLSADSARRWSRLGCMNTTGPCGVGAIKGSFKDDPDDLARGSTPVSWSDDLEVLGDVYIASCGMNSVEAWGLGSTGS